MEKFTPKDPNETVPLTFDFRAYLSGQAISAVTLVQITTFSGVDATPDDLIFGSAAQLGDRVQQNVQHGLVGVEYLVRVTVTTAAGFKYTLGRVLPVKLAGTW